MDLIALDFETANSLPGSACSFGVAVFRNGKLRQCAERLILPHATRRFIPAFYTSIHGIRMEDVADAPEFPYYAETLFSILESGLVLAHNAAFDMGVLRSLCELYHLRSPEIRYLCTCKAARRFWRGMENYKLDTLCRKIGHSFRHHDAREDAAAAGFVYLAMLRESGCSTDEEFAEQLRIRPGILSKGGDLPCLALPQPHSRKKPVRTGTARKKNPEDAAENCTPSPERP